MAHQNRRFLWSWIPGIILGIATFALLSRLRFYLESAFLHVPVTDPDVLLHLRRIEQIVGSGGDVPFVGIDRYSGFPGEYPYPYAPLLDWVGANLVWVFHALFPSYDQSFETIVGWIPALLGSTFIAALYCWITARTSNPGLGVLVSLLVSFSALFVFPFRYGQMDHHCLEAFFGWGWILTGISFAGRPPKSPGNLGFLFFGSALWWALSASWAGVPMLAGLFVVLAMALVFYGEEWMMRFGEFVAATLMIGSVLTLLTLWKMGHWEFSHINFSWFQPLLAFGCGMLLEVWIWAKRQSARLILPVVASVGCLIGVVLFGPTFVEGITNVSGMHPFIGTIAEQKSAISLDTIELSVSEVVAATGGWSLLLPFIIFVALKTLFRKEAILLVFIGLGTLLISLVRVRYFRWFGLFQGIFQGILAWEFIFLLRSRTKEISPQWRNPALALFVFPLFFAMVAMGFESTRDGIPLQRQDFINSFAWMQRNTPDPGGYFDQKTPTYGVMGFWDQGNAIAFFAKRPAIVNNLQYGLDHMARVYSECDEDRSYEYLRTLKARYWVVTPPVQGLFERVIPQLLASRFERGQLVFSQRGIDWGALPPIEQKKTVFHRLYRDIGLGKELGGGMARFRAVYCSPLMTTGGSPHVKIFQIAPGAEIHGSTFPGASIACFLPLTFRHYRKEVVYSRTATADQQGRFSLRVAYPTGSLSGGIQTGDEYVVWMNAVSGEKLMATCAVSLAAIEEGKPLPSLVFAPPPPATRPPLPPVWVASEPLSPDVASPALIRLEPDLD